MLFRVINNKSCYNLDNEDILREVIVKIGLERINMQEGVTVEVLLNNSAMGLVISFKFVKKQESKQKKIEKNLLPGTQGENGDQYNWRTEMKCNSVNIMASSLQS